MDFEQFWAVVTAAIARKGSAALRRDLAANEAGLRALGREAWDNTLGGIVDTSSRSGSTPGGGSMQGYAARAGKDGAMTVDEARAWAWSAAEGLAALPPPFVFDPLRGAMVPNKDDQGLSAANDGPIRTFLANGPEQSDAAYLGAVEYLVFHAGVQLDKADYVAARRALEIASPVSAEVAKTLVRGKARSTATEGENKNGTWRTVEKGVELDLKRTVKHANVGKAVLEPAGLLPGRDYEWRKERASGYDRQGRPAMTWYLVVYPHALPTVIAVLEANGREAMAASLRAASLVDMANPPPVPAAAAVERDLADRAADLVRGDGFNADVWRADTTYQRVYVKKNGEDLGYFDIRNGQIRDFTKRIPATTARKVLDLVPVEAAPARVVPAAPSGVEVVPMGSNFRISGIEPFWADLGLSGSRAFPGWAVVYANRAQHIADQLKALDPGAARVLENALGRVVDLRQLSDAPSLDDPRVSDATRDAVREALAPLRFPPGLGLRRHQEVSVGFLALKGRGLIGDDMGIGKTLTAIAAGMLHKLPMLVVAPAGVIYNWRNEIVRFAPGLHPVVVEGKTALPKAVPGAVVIVSWDMMRRRVADLLAWAPGYAVFDEAHYAKNYKAKRTIAAVSLAEAAAKVALLTGTPAENRGAEIFNQLQMVDPLVWRSFKDFARTYFQGEDGRFGFETGPPDPDTIDELRERIRNYMVRRLKRDVLDLPEKTRDYMWYPLTGKAKTAYTRVMSDFQNLGVLAWKRRVLGMARAKVKAGTWSEERAMAWVLAQEKAELTAGDKLVAIGYLRRAAGALKVPHAIEWIEQFRESSDEPLVVFIDHQAVLKAIGAALEAAGVVWEYVDGSVTGRKRTDAVLRFQSGQTQVLVATRALREGVTLTKASHILFVERWWVPTQEEQAEDRIYRDGATNAATIHYMMLEDTIDVKLHRMIDAKREDLDDTIGGNEYGKTMSDRQAEITTAAIYDELARELKVAAGAASGRISVAEYDAFMAGQGLALDEEDAAPPDAVLAVAPVPSGPISREKAIAMLVAQDVARWGENERAASQRQHAQLSHGLALNALAARAQLAGEPYHDIAGQAQRVLTRADRVILRKGG